jgi:PPM family protein phosphatase
MSNTNKNQPFIQQSSSVPPSVANKETITPSSNEPAGSTDPDPTTNAPLVDALPTNLSPIDPAQTDPAQTDPAQINSALTNESLIDPVNADASLVDPVADVSLIDPVVNAIEFESAPIAPSTLACTSCGEIVLASESFCESCGATLRPAVVSDTSPAPNETPASESAKSSACIGCGGLVDADSYCTECGIKQPLARDHIEIDFGNRAGGVADRGKRHHRNEDALQIGFTEDGRTIIIVCDGVSSSSRADEASQAAVDTALSEAKRLLDMGENAELALVHAAKLANEMVSSISAEPDGEPPSCTFVGAVVTHAEVCVAWIGDSRAYLVTDTEIIQLSRDDSWAVTQIDSGVMTEAQAFADHRAHVITRWMGSDSDALPPRTLIHTFDTTKTDSPSATILSTPMIMLCSDGLWNEVPEIEELNRLIRLDLNRTPFTLACDLCDVANAAGGRDNITVAIVPARPNILLSVAQNEPELRDSPIAIDPESTLRTATSSLADAASDSDADTATATATATATELSNYVGSPTSNGEQSHD